MPADLKIIKAANIICDDEPDESFHLQLDEVSLPDISKVFEEHQPGGGVMGLEISMNTIEPLTLPFKLIGINVSMLSRIGLNETVPHTYSIFKDVHDMRTRAQVRLLAVISGEMATVEQDGYNRKGLSGFDFEIKGIDRYRLTLGNEVIYDMDFFANRFIVRGNDQFAKTNANIGVI